MTNNNSYQVVNHEYVNTGGHCMVLVTTVCDKHLNSTVYVMTDSEGLSMSTVDFISNDLPWLEDPNTYICGYYTWPITDTINDDTLELYNDCYQQYLIYSCKDTKVHRWMQVDELPMKLKKLLPDGYEKWTTDEGLCVETDGEQLYYDKRWCSIPEPYSFDYILDAQEFMSALDKHLELPEEYNFNHNVSITVGNATLHGYDNAALINGIQHAIEDYLEDLHA